MHDCVLTVPSVEKIEKYMLSYECSQEPVHAFIELTKCADCETAFDNIK